MNHRPARAYIGLGSNRGDPVAQLRCALAALGRLPASRLQAVSPFYVSAPMGCRNQSPFINAVAALDTALAPMSLLRALQRIEAAQGRRRGRRRWGPRPLDLDLLLYGARRVRTACLRVPHPRLTQRAFVLRPLCDVAPGARIPPRKRRARAWLRRLGSQRVAVLAAPPTRFVIALESAAADTSAQSPRSAGP